LTSPVIRETLSLPNLPKNLGRNMPQIRKA
jgi:hypothetical protein